jgi:predicted MFS family arabinose efflux permease
MLAEVIKAMNAMVTCGYLFTVFIMIFTKLSLSSSSFQNTLRCCALLFLRGLGCLLGHFLSPYLHLWREDGKILTYSLILCSLNLFLSALLIRTTLTTLFLSYVFFSLSAICTIIETASQKMIFSMCPEISFVFIAWNPLMFGIGSIVGAVLYLFIEDDRVHLVIVALYTLALGGLSTTNLERDLTDPHNRATEERPPAPDQLKHSSLELLSGTVLFLLMGSSDAFLFLWNLYLRSMGEALSNSPRRDADLLLVVYLSSATFGKILGSYVSNRTNRLLSTLVFLLIATSTCILAIPESLAMFSNHTALLCIFAVLFGACHGPMIPFFFDHHFNLQKPTQASVHRLISWLHLGSLVIPTLIYFLWRETVLGPIALIAGISLGSGLCLALLCCSQSQAIKSSHQNGYSSIPDASAAGSKGQWTQFSAAT